MNIGIYYYKDTNKEIAQIIEQNALKHGFVIDNDNPDVVFHIGGDGTFLRAVQHYLNKIDKISFIGINNGTLGFFYDFDKDDISSLMDDIQNGLLSVKEYPLLKGEIEYKTKTETIYAVNEIRIENPFHTLISDVCIDDVKLEKFRGNGLVISSSLGSSAYNKSLGGAIIDHDIHAMELTEIASIQNNVYRSLGSSFVVSLNKSITLSGEFNGAVAGYDHLNINKDDELVKVTVSDSDLKIRIAYNKKLSYINKIRKSFIL